MADKQDRPAAARDFAHFPEAFLLECGIADGKDFIDNKDFRVQVRGHGEGEPHVHAGAVAFDRGVDELLDLGEGDDLVELAADFGLGHAQDRTIEEDVLAAGQLRVEAGTHLQQRADPAVDLRPAAGGLGDAREDLEQRRLARAVAADDAHHLAAPDLEGDILERPELVGGGGGMPAAEYAAQRIAQGVVALLERADAVELGEVFDPDGDVGHGLRITDRRSKIHWVRLYPQRFFLSNGRKPRR
ncbi:MAG: hypothetical protein BWY52_02294 [Chloroflexi bacterium ADurb.Bin325]|nr:MAG: hypothetical protein BWY52_02294 [Chloroflexi bacterium ADurb.Bin325]